MPHLDASFIRKITIRGGRNESLSATITIASINNKKPSV